MVTFRRPKNTNANRGVAAEKAVQSALEKWAEGHPRREYHRLLDTKAAGRFVKAALADFEYYSRPDSTAGFPTFGLIEVKQTEHPYRLARDKVPQLPAMRKRAQCGGTCLVVVFHSVEKVWRVLDVEWMESNGDKGSWNISAQDGFRSPIEALANQLPEVFG